MNKRFKGPRFDERITGDAKQLINLSHEYFQIQIRPVGKDADLVVQGRYYKNHGFKTTVEPGMINEW